MNRFCILSFLSVLQVSCSGGLKLSASSTQGCTDADCPPDSGETTAEENAGGSGSSGGPCKDPPLDKIPADVQVRLCNGVMAAGKLALCSGTVRKGCLTTSAFPAVRISPEAYGRMHSALSVNGQSGQLSDCGADKKDSCITTSRFRSVATHAVDQNKIKAGTVLAGVNGSLDVPCAAGGAVGCVTTPEFPSVKSEDFSAANIAANATIGSVTGTLKVTRRCRNAARLSRYDAYGPSNLVFTLPTSGVDTATDTFTFSGNHGMKTGFPFRMSGSPLPAPLLAGTAYYAIVDPAFPAKTRVALSESDAFNNIGIDITDQGSDAQTVRPFGDGVTGFWDLIDDFANDAAHPTDLFFGAGHACGPDSFQRVDGTAGLIPTGMIPVSGNTAWTEIWRDDTTGLMFTNVLYSGGGTTMHADALKLCASLDSGDGAGKWYLPTQKELIGLYINGVSHVPMSGRDYLGFWTSTQVKNTAGNAWHVYLADGSAAHGLRINTGYAVLCVRLP